MNTVKIYHNFLHLGNKLTVLDACHVQESLAGDGDLLVGVFIGIIEDLPDARLDDHLGTLVAGEQGHVDDAVGYALGVFVEDGVHLCVADVHVLGLQRVGGALSPRQLVVGAAAGKTVVADTDDTFLIVDYTGSNLLVDINYYY